MFALDAPSLVTRVMRTTGRNELGDERLSPAIDLLGADLDSGTSQLHLSGRREAQLVLRRLLERRGRPVSSDGNTSVDHSTGPPLLIAALPTTPADAVAAALPSGWSATRVATWSSLPTAAAGGFFANDAMHGCAIDLHSAFFECAWHVPAYAEWLSEQTLDATYAWLCGGSEDHPTAMRSLTFGLNPPSDAWPGPTVVVPISDRDTEAFVDAVIQLRHRFSHRVDAESVERYWRWRLERWPTAGARSSDG